MKAPHKLAKYSYPETVFNKYGEPKSKSVVVNNRVRDFKTATRRLHDANNRIYQATSTSLFLLYLFSDIKLLYEPICFKRGIPVHQIFNMLHEDNDKHDFGIKINNNCKFIDAYTCRDILMYDSKEYAKQHGLRLNQVRILKKELRYILGITGFENRRNHG